MREYATGVQSARRNVLLVASDNHFPPPSENYFINGSRAYWADMFSATSALATDTASDSFGWICSGIDDNGACSNQLESIQSQGVSSWRVGWYCDQDLHCDTSRWPVDYCLSERAEPRCKLYVEPTIGAIVTALNLGEYASLFACRIVVGICDENMHRRSFAMGSWAHHKEVRCFPVTSRHKPGEEILLTRRA